MKIPRILGVGVDIQNVARIQKLVTRGAYFEKRFLSGVFHPLEIEEFHKREEPKVKYQYLASRWALKEAMVKACGDPSLKYPGMCLMRKEGIKKPYVHIEGEHNIQLLHKNLEVSSIQASISHEEHYAVAFVIMETIKEEEEVH